MQAIRIKGGNAIELSKALKSLAHEVNKASISIQQLNNFSKPFWDMAVKRQAQDKLIRKKFSIKI